MLWQSGVEDLVDTLTCGFHTANRRVLIEVESIHVVCACKTVQEDCCWLRLVYSRGGGILVLLDSLL